MGYLNFLKIRIWLRAVIIRLCPGLQRLLTENRELRRENSCLRGELCLARKEAREIRGECRYLSAKVQQLEEALEVAQTTGHDLLGQIDGLVVQRQAYLHSK